MIKPLYYQLDKRAVVSILSRYSASKISSFVVEGIYNFVDCLFQLSKQKMLELLILCYKHIVLGKNVNYIIYDMKEHNFKIARIEYEN